VTKLLHQMSKVETNGPEVLKSITPFLIDNASISESQSDASVLSYKCRNRFEAVSYRDLRRACFENR
jgi:hypothetical protein